MFASLQPQPSSWRSGAANDRDRPVCNPFLTSNTTTSTRHARTFLNSRPRVEAVLAMVVAACVCGMLPAPHREAWGNLQVPPEGKTMGAEGAVPPPTSSPLGSGMTQYFWLPTQYTLSNARYDGSVTLYDQHFLLIGGCVDALCETESSYMDMINPLPPGNVSDLGILPINVEVNMTALRSKAPSSATTTYSSNTNQGGVGGITATTAPIVTLGEGPVVLPPPATKSDREIMREQPPTVVITTRNGRRLRASSSTNGEEGEFSVEEGARIAADIVQRQLLLSGQYATQIVSSFNLTDRGITYGSALWVVGPCSSYYPLNHPAAPSTTTTPTTSTETTVATSPMTTTATTTGPALSSPFGRVAEESAPAPTITSTSPSFPFPTSSTSGGGGGGPTPEEIDRAFVIAKHKGLWSLSGDLQSVNVSAVISDQFPLRANASCVSYLNRIFIVGGANIDSRPGYRCRRGSLPLSKRVTKFGQKYAATHTDRSMQSRFHAAVGRDDMVVSTFEHDEDREIERGVSEATLLAASPDACPISSASLTGSNENVPVLFDTIDAFDVRTHQYHPDLISFSTPRMNAAVTVDNAMLYIAGGQMAVAVTPTTSTASAGNASDTNYTLAASPNVEGLLFSIIFLYNESAPFTYVPLPNNPVLEIINVFKYNGGLSAEQMALLQSTTAQRDPELRTIQSFVTKGLNTASLNVWSISKIFSFTGEIIMITGMSGIAMLPCYPINSTLTPSPSNLLMKSSDSTTNTGSASERPDDFDSDAVDPQEIAAIRAELGFLLPTSQLTSYPPPLSTAGEGLGSTEDFPTDVGSASCINASGSPNTWSYTYADSSVLRASVLEIPMTIFAGRIYLTLIALGGETPAGGAVSSVHVQSMLHHPTAASDRVASPDGPTIPRPPPLLRGREDNEMPLPQNKKNDDDDAVATSLPRMRLVDDTNFPTAIINQMWTSIASLSPVDIQPYYLVDTNVTFQFYEFGQPVYIRFSPNSACYTNAGGTIDMLLPAGGVSNALLSMSFTPLLPAATVYLCMSLGETNISYFTIPLGSDSDVEVKALLYGCLNPLQPFSFVSEAPIPPTPPTTPAPTPNNNDSTFATWISNSTHAIAFTLIVVAIASVSGMLIFLFIRNRRNSEKKRNKRGGAPRKDRYGRLINDSDSESTVNGAKHTLFSVNATDVSGRFALDNDDAVVRNTTLDSRYRIKKRIGQGSFSSVYLVKRKSDGLEFAMKYLICGNDRDRLEAIKECETINSIQGHPNIIALFDMFMNYEFNPTPSPSSLDFGAGLGVPMSINQPAGGGQQQHQQPPVGTPQFIRNNMAQTRLLEKANGNANGGYGATVSPPLQPATSPNSPGLGPSAANPNNSNNVPMSPKSKAANVHTRYLCLVMEYHKSGDLCHYLLRNSTTNRELFKQAYREYMQQQQIVHQSGAYNQLPGAGQHHHESSSSFYSGQSTNSTAAMPSVTAQPPSQQVLSDPDMIGTPPVSQGISSSSRNGYPVAAMAATSRPPRYQPLGESALLSVTMQLCSALHHLHSCRPAPIVHRDLKPENVLIRGALPNRFDTYIPVLITDFGLAFLQEENRRSGRGGGTRPYISPESWKGQTTVASDMWSLGCVLYALATERLTADTVRVMFEDAKRPKFHDEIMYDLVEDHGYSFEFAQLVVSLLDVDPKKRPTAGSLLKRFVEVDPANRQLSSGRSAPSPYGSLRSDGQDDHNHHRSSPHKPYRDADQYSSDSGGSERLSRNSSGIHDDDHHSSSNKSFSEASSSSYNHPDPLRRKFVVLLPPQPTQFSSTHSSTQASQQQPGGGGTRTSGASTGRRSPGAPRSSGGSSRSNRSRGNTTTTTPVPLPGGMTTATTNGGPGVVRRSSRKSSGLQRKKHDSGTRTSTLDKAPHHPQLPIVPRVEDGERQ